jgi:glucose-1-phosphate cytidylyltransferase
MKAVILAGGLGTRISEETASKPKPMVEIGGRPLLWHVMKIYSSHGINDFIICCGYKGYVIKEYFANYFLHMSDVTFDMTNNLMNVHHKNAEPWRVTLVDTGDTTQTGGRLKKVKNYLGDDDFCFTYGDGVSDVDISQLIYFHKSHGRLATLTAVQPPGRFGALEMDGTIVNKFLEKPIGEGGGWINGGFFILNPNVIDLIKHDHTSWEGEPLELLARNGDLHAWYHHGFWQPMDTLRDKQLLEQLWHSGQAPWKSWDQ